MSVARAVADPYLPLSREFVVDPYPFYARLRAASPVYWSEAYHAWFVSRYADVLDGVRDSVHFSARRMERLLAPLGADDPRRAIIRERSESQMISSDAPEHTRLRALVAPALAPRQVEALRRRIEAAANELLDRLGSAGEMDIVAAFAYPLPMIVIGNLLGIPERDRDRVKAWADVIAGFLSTGRVEPADVDDYMTAWEEMSAYLRGLVNQDRTGDGGDVLSLLLSRIAAGDATEDEAVANLVLLAVAGHETTTNTIATGTMVLLEHPDQLDLLRARPELMPLAVEEILRYEPVAQRSTRLARAGAMVGGQPMEEGQLVHFLLGAANRDPPSL
jgi:cytochrome P450